MKTGLSRWALKLECLVIAVVAPMATVPALGKDNPSPASIAGIAEAARSADRDRKLEEKHFVVGSPVAIRVFKAEAELEVWMQNGDRFEHVATYPICYFSGALGPKRREGDRQAPEGFYTVSASQLRRKGRLPRSFDIGFPNAFDSASGATGSAIMVHGGCNSIGCFAMTDAVMDEIFYWTDQALKGGQEEVSVHVFPFRMTDSNLATYVNHPWHGFWSNLKEVYDVFERTHIPPEVSVCGGRYVLRSGQEGKDLLTLDPLASECEDKLQLPSPEVLADLQASERALMRRPVQAVQIKKFVARGQFASRKMHYNSATRGKSRITSSFRQATSRLR